jgi:hypothetical protein
MDMRLNLWWGALNLAIGAVIALLIGWHLWGAARVDPSNEPRPEVRVSPGVVIAERVPVATAKPPAGIPAGTTVTDTLTGTIAAPGCAEPVEVRCHVAEEPGGGRRLILEVPGGEVVTARHEHVQDSDKQSTPKPWRVIALAGYSLDDYEWKPGLAVGRDVGPFSVEAGALPGYVWGGIGLRF